MKHTFIPRSMIYAVQNDRALAGSPILWIGNLSFALRQASLKISIPAGQGYCEDTTILGDWLGFAACDSHTDTSAPNHQQYSCFTAPAALGLEGTPCTKSSHKRYSGYSLFNICDTFPSHSLGKRERQARVICLCTELDEPAQVCIFVPTARLLAKGRILALSM